MNQVIYSDLKYKTNKKWTQLWPWHIFDWYNMHVVLKFASFWSFEDIQVVFTSFIVVWPYFFHSIGDGHDHQAEPCPIQGWNAQREIQTWRTWDYGRLIITPVSMYYLLKTVTVFELFFCYTIPKN